MLPPEIPGQLLECAPAPVVPGEAASQRDIALYVLDLEAAGQDCRAKLGMVKELLVSRTSQGIP